MNSHYAYAEKDYVSQHCFSRNCVANFFRKKFGKISENNDHNNDPQIWRGGKPSRIWIPTKSVESGDPTTPRTATRSSGARSSRRTRRDRFLSDRQGSILRNSVSAEKFLDKFCLSNTAIFYTQIQESILRP
jgi:hypothetical protein